MRVENERDSEIGAGAVNLLMAGDAFMSYSTRICMTRMCGETYKVPKRRVKRDEMIMENSKRIMRNSAYIYGKEITGINSCYTEG